jgi:transposase
MIEISEVLYQWQQGRSKSKIAESLGISRPTLRNYLNLALAAGLTVVSSNEAVAAIALEVTAKVAGSKGTSAPIRESIAVHDVRIRQLLAEPDITARQIWRLLAESGYCFSERSVNRYVRQIVPIQPAVTVRIEVPPGSQAQVDFGQVTLTLGGKRRRVWAFVMTLSYSRHRYVRFVERQDVSTWLDCHIRAFQFYGGVPATVLLDNLKSGVVKPDLYDPTINRAYAELERHHGFIADPAKVRTPEHKGKVERSMPLVRQQLAAGRTYLDLAEANEKALLWCRDEIGQRPHGTTHEAPMLRFTRDEKATLKELPASRFDLPTWKECTVHPDHHVVFEKSYYSVPTRFVGKKVWVRKGIMVVEIYHKELQIKTHPTAHRPGTWRTDLNDYPEGKKLFLQFQPAWCKKEAHRMGEFAGRMAEEILSPHALVHLRKAQGLIRLGEKHGAKKLDEVCRYLLENGSNNLASIKRLLEKGIPQVAVQLSPPPISDEGASLLHPAISFGEVSL